MGLLYLNNKEIIKKEYFFCEKHHPSNFYHFIDKFPDYSVGCTTYEGLYSHEELLELERHADECIFQ